MSSKVSGVPKPLLTLAQTKLAELDAANAAALATKVVTVTAHTANTGGLTPVKIVAPLLSSAPLAALAAYFGTHEIQPQTVEVMALLQNFVTDNKKYSTLNPAVSVVVCKRRETGGQCC